MKYMGSKNRIAKYLLPIILKNRKLGQWYVEPFVGGANMIDKVSGNRIGSDTNPYLIALLTALKDGWNPPVSVTEEEYRHVKNNKELYSKKLVGYVGVNSYGGKFFGGYRRDSMGRRNYWREHLNNINKQRLNLKGIVFFNKDYRDIELPNNSIIYCDPPYLDSTRYARQFDHGLFWEWCRCKYAEGHSVFVSEYDSPKDFVCVWRKKIVSSLTRNTGSKKGVEKLFIKRMAVK